MPIDLRDIRNAFEDYINNKVVVTITKPKQENNQLYINPNETFKFDITAQNASDVDGGVALKNIIFWISVANPDIAKLFVPSAGPMVSVVRSTRFDDPNTVLASGALVTEMFIFPPADQSTFGAYAPSAKTLNLKGKADPKLITVIQKTDIKFLLIATIDTDWLFVQSPHYNNYPNAKTTSIADITNKSLDVYPT